LARRDAKGRNKWRAALHVEGRRNSRLAPVILTEWAWIRTDRIEGVDVVPKAWLIAD
jgi:hypothetical protein